MKEVEKILIRKENDEVSVSQITERADFGVQAGVTHLCWDCANGCPANCNKVKDIKKKGEAAKVAVRNVRRDANDTLKKMEKSTDITEDERKEGEEKIQKMTDKYVAKIDKSVENKSKEIMTV